MIGPMLPLLGKSVEEMFNRHAEEYLNAHALYIMPKNSVTEQILEESANRLLLTQQIRDTLNQAKNYKEDS